MADYVPVHPAGAPVTYTASAATVGGQLLAVTGNDAVAPTSGAVAAWVGVASKDTASGARLAVHSGGVQELTVTADTVAGGQVVPAAAGAVAPYDDQTHTPDQVVGLVVRGALAGAKARVQLSR